MRQVLWWGLVGVGALLAATPARAQERLLLGSEVIRGHVIDPVALVPVTGADVVLVQGDERVASTTTNDAGFFIFIPPGPGTYALEVRRLGYVGSRSATFEIDRGEELTVEYGLQPDAIALEPLVVTARSRSGMQQFLRNMEEWGRGIFLTPAMIDSIAPNHYADVFRNQEGLMLTWGWGLIDADPDFPVRGVVPRIRSFSSDCMVFMVDGMMLDRDDRYILRQLNRKNIVAVEIYRSVWEVPPHLKYGGESEWERTWTGALGGSTYKDYGMQLCGVTAYWTTLAW